MHHRLTAHRQRGVTAIGWVFLLVPFAIVGYFAIRAIPVYNNYMSVVRALDNFAQDNQGNGQLTKEQIKDLLSRKWSSEYIDNPGIDDLVMKREGGGWILQANYEQVEPLFYNVSLLFEFEKTVSFK